MTTDCLVSTDSAKTRHRWKRISLALLLAVSHSLASAKDAWSQDVEFDIPSQSIQSALNEFSRQAGVQVMVASEMAAGQRTAGIQGRLGVTSALTQLLQNTNLTYQTVGENTVAIKPVAAATAPAKEPPPPPPSRSTRGARSSNETAAVGQEDQGLMGEVIVTATKRAALLQDVPLSIAVLRMDDIEQRGLAGAEDYLRGVAGANQTDLGWSGQAIIIRGMETNLGNQNEGAGSTTASYFGETPTTGSAGMIGSNVDIKLVDVQRVEVLRGPQGTAFGNASIGGAVRVIPMAPQLDRVEGKVSAGYGVTSGTGGDNYTFQGIANVPLIDDKLAIRAVAYKFSDSGFYRNRAGSDAAVQAFAAAQGASAFAIDQEEAGAAESTGGRIAATFKPNEALDITVSYLTQKTEVDGWGTATAPTYDQTILQVSPEHVHRGQTAGVADRDIDIANATLNYDLSWGDLTATYSYIDSGSLVDHPYTEAPLPWAASDGRETSFRGHVGELRLVTKFDGAWNFLGGVYAERNKNSYLTSIIFNGPDPSTLFAGATDRLLGYGDDRRKMTQKAAFGEVSWEIVPDLTLTGGARYYQYDRTIDLLLGGYFSGGETTTHEEADDSGSNFRANLSYKIGEGGLVYAGWAQGFRLGQPQAPLPTATCDIDRDGIVDDTGTSIGSTARIEADSVDSYEIGSKFTLLDRRFVVDAALFRMDWFDIVMPVLPPCNFSYLTNAGRARSEGLELQADFQVTRSFRMSFGGSWINARLTDDVVSTGLEAGDRLPGSAKVNANLGLVQEFDVAGYAASVRADAIYVGPFYSRVGQTLNTDAGDYVKLDLAARVTLQKLDIDFYVRNVTNEDAFSMRSNYGLSSEFHGYRLRPRTVGVQLGYDF